MNLDVFDKVEPEHMSYNTIIKNRAKCTQGVFVGTPTTGLIRFEWAMARFSQVIPCNFGYIQAVNWIPNYAPLGYLVADAQNLICRGFLQSKCDWLFLIEHDNVLPPDCFLRMNDYIRRKEVPIVSGLYYTKSYPSEPLVYRGRGNNYYNDWRIGDLVWCDAVPTGTLLIHRSIIQTIWDESETYNVGVPSQETRRVFNQPERVWFDPEKGWDTAQGTSDMEFCSKIMVNNIFEKAGWPEFQKKEFPFLVDTNIFVGHIDEGGRVYPSEEEKQKWMPGGVGDSDPVMLAEKGTDNVK